MRTQITRLDYYVGVAILTVLLLVGGYGLRRVVAQAPPDAKVTNVQVLEAHEIHLLDHENHVRLLMTVDGDNAQIAVLDKTLYPRVLIEANSVTGKVVVGGIDGKAKVTMSEEPAGSGLVAVADEHANAHFVTPLAPDKFKHASAH